MLVRGGVSLESSVNGTIEIPVGGSASFAWNADLSDGTKHAVGPTPMALGMVSLTLGGADRVAFAVYSADDGTLNFYKKMDVPAKGSTFEGKTVTEIYMGFETDRYGAMNSSNYIPWKTVADRVRSAKVVDDGIAPVSVAHWFDYFDNLSSCDLGNLDFDNVESMNGLFYQCYSLTSLTLPQTDFSSVTNMFATFHGCNALSFDCSGWNVTVSINHGSFNLYALGVILPKPWQPTAFAVFSSDDGSLNFYKREFKDMPSAEDVFEGKIATEVYTGIETDTYDRDGGGWYDAVTTPWYGRHSDILSVNVIDDGITPKELSYYFQNLENVTLIDISKFSPPESQGLFHTFAGCTKLTDIALNQQTPLSLDSSFTNCKALVSVNLSHLNLGNVQVCPYVFAGCSSLKTIEGVADIGKANPYRIEESFLGCSSLESLDLSGWNTSYAVMDNGQVVRLFDECPNLRSVRIGSDWTWNQNGYGLLPIQSFDGADGKWYSLTTGKGYAPADIPSGKADTYVASKELLPKIAFAVYSEKDGSFDFYKRAFCDMPAAGDAFDNKTVTSVYTGFEEDAYTGTWPNDDCPWFSIATKVKNVTVVDTIKPKSMAWWFNQFTTCTSFDLGNVDTSECVSFERLFSGCGSVVTANLRGLGKWNTGNVQRMDACFDGMYRLIEVPGISSWDTASCISFSSVFYNCSGLHHVDISHWSNKSCKPGPQSWGYVSFGHTGGGYPNLEYVKIGSGWDHVGDLLRNTSTLMKVTGADGNWYALSDGNAYSSSSVPDNKADMYYTTKALLDRAKTPIAFAVYSDDDHSLDFYKRSRYLMPVSESSFEGKAATAVYTGFETASYGKKEGSDIYIPWASVASRVLSAEIVDDGIAPVSIAHWFDYFGELRACNLEKLNVVNVISMDGTFYYNYALSSLTMPTSEFSSLVNMSSAFTCCYVLKSVDLSKVNFSNITDLAWTFTGCHSLVLDCSNWDVSNVTSYGHFNNDAPNVTLPKAWQPTAFAVYSTDDGSLDFYKREFRKLPKIGDTFEGKTVTEVYTGIETTRYTPIDYNDSNGATNVPWYSRSSDCKSVSVVDNGIKPINLAFWFHRFKNCISFDVSKLDTSSTLGIEHIFYDCENVKNLDLSTWDLSHCESAVSAFAYCYNLESIEFGSIPTANFKSYGCYWMFSDCSKLSLDCSEWVIDPSAIQYAFNSGAPNVIPPKTWK